MEHRWTIRCLRCGSALERAITGTMKTAWRCAGCSFEAEGGPNYIDLAGSEPNETSAHYCLQWGPTLAFFDFVQRQPSAKRVMPGGQLGWNELFTEIRRRAEESPVSVYDAACGFGGITNELIDDTTARNLLYVGADIHGSLELIIEKIPSFKTCGLLLRWDISRSLPVAGLFDYVLCRASLHHTSDAPKTFATLCGSLKAGARIAISVYRKKGVCREASDDALRAIISKMTPEVAFKTSRQFTVLGQALQRIQETADIPEDLPLLRIKKGRISVHSLFYDGFLKCFYNDDFGEEYSTLVNYDWYHPPYAYRYELDEVKSWFSGNGIEIIDVRSIPAQYYVLGVKRSG